jgi:hypothetical protein
MYFSAKKTVFLQDWFEAFLSVCADGVGLFYGMGV